MKGPKIIRFKAFFENPSIHYCPILVRIGIIVNRVENNHSFVDGHHYIGLYGKYGYLMNCTLCRVSFTYESTL